MLNEDKSGLRTDGDDWEEYEVSDWDELDDAPWEVEPEEEEEEEPEERMDLGSLILTLGALWYSLDD